MASRNSVDQILALDKPALVGLMKNNRDARGLCPANPRFPCACGQARVGGRGPCDTRFRRCPAVITISEVGYHLSPQPGMAKEHQTRCYHELVATRRQTSVVDNFASFLAEKRRYFESSGLIEVDGAGNFEQTIRKIWGGGTTPTAAA
ncbi:hypothetical protein GGTG_04668 [Gaeumannomyces tritici R3-111a-1]|uniref:Uncharacterized protein n=1 Tax=Gaeumannomyces tritici (strain R3-111a-1) TaxID=644352 RepID=J3NTR8_GAET3|nr:hypothetical protein GGTG_04668 [Gaeumannomyces tritici R3-111a-1]EJT79583.1 hypothetical protein GGTG_04668 [Gaeumannomyces tritici R3-111a-1]